MNVQKMLPFALIAGGVFVLAKVLNVGEKAAAAVGAGYTNAREAVASGLFALFAPSLTPDAAETTYYTVRFPDGNHSVPRYAVDSNGYFSRNGKNYRLVIDTRIKSGVNKTAFPV